MPVRHVLLGALAVGVLGLAVYLFLQVRASPAAPQPRAPVAKRDQAKEPDEPAPKSPRTVTERDSRAGRGSGMISRVGGRIEGSAPPPIAPTPVPDATVGVKLDAMMAEANKAYDKQDFDEAKSIARRVLVQSPNNARMLRILVSTACIDHDAVEAQKHYNVLTDPSDRQQMKTRCQRDFGIALTDIVKK